MSDDTDINGLRGIRAKKALSTAMFSLLGKHYFRRITVRDICAEALVSRATFYSYFTDKYNFLKWWLIAASSDDVFDTNGSYEVTEHKINQFINENAKIIRNLFMDADRWTLEALFDALYSILRLPNGETKDGTVNSKHIVRSNFYIGGMIYYIMWQIKNNFPPNIAMMNEHLLEIIKNFQDWN